MSLTVSDYYNLYTGGNLVSGGGYLWPLINEPENSNSLKLRQKRAAYPNFQFKIVEIYKNYVLCGKPKYEDSEVIDMSELVRDLLSNILIGGRAYILTLSSGIPKVYRADVVNIDENKTITIICGDQKTIISNSKITIITKGQQNIVEDFKHDDQFICAFWNEARASLIRDTAPMNIQIYNFTSILDTLALQSAHFNTTGPALGDSIKSLKPFTHVPYNNGENPLAFVAPDTNGMINVRSEISARIMNMAAVVGLVREFSEELKIEASGVAHAFQMFDTNATVLQMAKMTERFCNATARVSKLLIGGKLASVSLDPLLSPTASEEKLIQLRWIRDNFTSPKAIIEANVSIAEIGFSHLPIIERTEILNEIRKMGIDNNKRPELSFNQLDE